MSNLKNNLINNIIHISNLKQALSHRLNLKKVQRVIKLAHNALLKPYIEKKKKQKLILKSFFN